MPAVARTAIGPVVILAVDQRETRPLLWDGWAERVLPTAARLVVACARWRPVRRALFLATERKARGLWAGVLCRKRYVDERVAEALDLGAEAVLVLGAGLDPLGLRLCAVPVFEVDFPAVLARRPAPADADEIAVPADLEARDLVATLERHAYRGGLRTVVVWEGVTQYLTAESMRATLADLSSAAPGSALVFTYIRRDFLDGARYYGAERAHRAFVRRGRWRFGLHPEQVAAFLAEYGWLEVEQVGAAEHTARFLVPAGRELPVTDIERCVYAVKV
ncbi:class I SAM-dependent methyltransferase [Actinokineospora guangxiensis]|uniref:S-adenosyl-L-methionine-dependent methyltransferase n=1 Tax=Actinokineospora guangxiensis TaxID=1490288 RepID=A0ABW0EY14_9PSEU